jgi:superfamily II DNA or RNA helicase
VKSAIPVAGQRPFLSVLIYYSRMLYTLTDIETQIAPQTFADGWKWFSGAKVTAPNIQRGGEIVTAVIHQTDGRPLRVYVRTVVAANKLSFQGECSCRQRNNCEHVVAVLLQALHDRSAMPEQPSEKQTTLTCANGAAPVPTTGATAAPTQMLLYLLRADADGFVVVPTVARHLKQGGYSLGRTFKPGRSQRGTPARFLRAEDLELLTALESLPRATQGAPLLQGMGSDPLLQSLLATGRFKLADDDDRLTPLRRGANRPIRFDWQCNEAAIQEITPCTDPGCDQLLLLETTWYLDSSSSECGRIDSELPGELVHELLVLPLLGPEQVDEVREKLNIRFPGTVIPLPQSFLIETMPPAPPVPCLCLITEERGLGSSSVHYDFVRLRFDYGGFMLDPRGPNTRLHDDHVIRIQRDHQAEHAAMGQLHNLGLARYDAINQPDHAEYLTPDSEISIGKMENWLLFQSEHLPWLRDRGWRIDFHNFRFRLGEVTGWSCNIEQLSREDWFSIGFGVEMEGQQVDLLPILLGALRELPRDFTTHQKPPLGDRFVTLADAQNAPRILRIPADRLETLLKTLLELHRPAVLQAADRLHVTRAQLAGLTSLEPNPQHSQLQWLGDAEAKDLIDRLRNLDGIPEVAPPAGLKAELRPYQHDGLNWLQFLREYRLAGILADDMGLGKTLQALAHLLLEKASGRADCPSLVVAPTSLMFNWRQEAQRFTPQLKVLVLQGPRRREHFADIAEYDLILTTYPLLARDQRLLLTQPWHLLILDEAQVIKNPRSQASQVVRKIEARHRLCLTGTPMENHLGEMWSLFDVLLPGFLGDSKSFHQLFRTPIEKHGNDAAAQRLRRRIRPFLLRRTKQQVATELPDKTEMVQSVELGSRQRELYETVRLAMHHRVRGEVERQGLARSQIVVLDALLKLRQVCCDPRLVDREQAQAVHTSAKLETLMQLLPEMIEEGRRVLLFSQFTGMLDLIEVAVKQAGIDYVKLTGRTRDRQTPVQRFQQGAVPLFLISLKAGGVGLNLTTADTVIHYDPWWNPAVERQATDRAHRIGQSQAVFVYKLICSATVEEKIQAMQQRKQALADGLYQAGGRQQPQWSSEDLDELFGLLRETAREN